MVLGAKSLSCSLYTLCFIETLSSVREEYKSFFLFVNNPFCRGVAGQDSPFPA